MPSRVLITLFIGLVVSLFLITAVLYNLLPEELYAQEVQEAEPLKPIGEYSSSTLDTLTPTQKDLSLILSYLEHLTVQLSSVSNTVCEK